MHFHIITIFPNMFNALNYGITDRAQKKGLIQINSWNLRDFSIDKHRRVDERPYGGGPGMVMMYEPLKKAIQAIKKTINQPSHTIKVIHLTPQGKTINQKMLQTFVDTKQIKNLIFLAGRYEGIDERFIEDEVDEEWSIGDYVLSGGELAAMVIIDSITRLLPGALGDEESVKQDSFSNILLDHPHYTRPEEINGRKVPEVLLSGDHKAIAAWRKEQATSRTQIRRPDLLNLF